MQRVSRPAPKRERRKLPDGPNRRKASCWPWRTRPQVLAALIRKGSRAARTTRSGTRAARPMLALLVVASEILFQPVANPLDVARAHRVSPAHFLDRHAERRRDALA